MPRSGMPHLPKKRAVLPVHAKCKNGHKFLGQEAQLNDMKCPECNTEDWELIKVI